LFFIPLPYFSHFIAAVKTAELLARRHHSRLRISVLLLNFPPDDRITSYISGAEPDLNFIALPPPSAADIPNEKPGRGAILKLIEAQKPAVRDAVSGAFQGRKSNIPAGFVVDMFCATAMVDVADEFGAPAYVYFTCSAATLALIFHAQSRRDEFGEDLTAKCRNPGELLAVPGFKNPVPTSVMPDLIFFEEHRDEFFAMSSRFRRTKGILINSFLEFEDRAITAMSEDGRLPPVYPVGPVLQDSGEDARRKYGEIMDWLDEQPDSSVVFLCFGSMVAFEGDQVREIAAGIELSGHRFLWSLRKPPPPDGNPFSSVEYEDFGEVLPEGLLNGGKGMVMGWAPQTAVLAHRAVGGFVSHCGWNSTLESVWFGVPVAAWPMAAEQQANAFQLVKEFEMAVEIKIDYRSGGGEIVAAERIKDAIGKLMDLKNPIRLKLQELKKKSRASLSEGQSSAMFL
ncbi:lignan glucosyltransferase, partial [Genlisea aurea]